MARTINVNGTTIAVPDNATDEQVAQIIQARMPAPREPDSFMDNVLDVAGELANAANRTITEGLDFLGPGSVNAGLRLAGAPFQLPTFTGGLEATPGGQGGFMEEGLARDVVRGAGTAIGAVPGLISAGPRNMANLKDAALELSGIGGAGTQPAVSGAGILQDLVDNPYRMVELADQANFPVTPGERFNNQSLRNIEAAIDSRPMLFNPMHRIQNKRQDLLNRAASESIGAPPGERLVAENMGTVADNISDEFRRLDGEEALLVTDRFHDNLAAAEATARQRVFSDPEQVTRAIDGVMDKIDESGALSAVDYQNLTSEFKKKIRQSYGGGAQGSVDPQFADTLQQIVDALDELALDNLDGAALARLKEARRKWRSLTQLEKSGAVRQSGDVSGPLLGQYLRRTDRSGYARGKNQSDLYNLTRLTQAFPGRPDSGTATRQFLNDLSLNPGKALLSIAAAPLVSGAANLYMGAPSLLARGARVAQQNPLVLDYVSRAAQQPGRLIAAPLRAGYGVLED